MAIERDTAHAVPVDKDGCYTISQFCRPTGIGRTGLHGGAAGAADVPQRRQEVYFWRSMV